MPGGQWDRAKKKVILPGKLGELASVSTVGSEVRGGHHRMPLNPTHWPFKYICYIDMSDKVPKISRPF